MLGPSVIACLTVAHLEGKLVSKQKFSNELTKLDGCDTPKSSTSELLTESLCSKSLGTEILENASVVIIITGAFPAPILSLSSALNATV